jgi:hypothetical protein
MSEPLEERLSRFTPDATGLNRDALLFTAGRVSVHPRRRWPALAGVLAVSQLLTIVCLWPRTPLSPSPEMPFITTESILPNPKFTPAPKPDPSEWRVLRQRIQDTDVDYSTPPSDEPMVPKEPPLRAFGTPLPDFLN